MTLFTLGHGKQTSGSVSKRLKLLGYRFSKEEPEIKILQQMISPNRSLKLTGFRMSAQTCRFRVATHIATSFTTTHMGFVTSIAGVIFGGRYHLKLQASATGWS
jgi:hypothetical protein